MVPVDRFLSEAGFKSARYVDDIYIFVSTVAAAEKLIRQLIPFLRSYDLSLNEAKCTILPKSALITEEPDLEALFTNAVKEIEDQLDTGEETSDGGYGFQSEWEDIDDDEDEEEDVRMPHSRPAMSR